MIEIVSASRCTGCNICVAACPTNVFEPDAAGGPPRIARQDDCQTCYMCELYCPEDALYVAPLAEHAAQADEAQVPLGSYRASIGWGRGRAPVAAQDASFRLMRRV
jgi:NAD-dependent dihydropyrimidine dehydrogenase PreA subunit